MTLTITTLFFRGQFLDYVQEMLVKKYVCKLLIILSLKQCVTEYKEEKNYHQIRLYFRL